MKPSIVSRILTPLTNAMALISQLFILSFRFLLDLFWNSSFIMSYKHIPGFAIQANRHTSKHLQIMMTKLFSWPCLSSEPLPSLFPTLLGRLFTAGRSSSPNTQLKHCPWPSALRGHHWLFYCQIQGHFPVLTFWTSLKDWTCLMTHCFTKRSVLLVYILPLSSCFPPIFLTFPFLFFFFFSVNSLFFLFLKWRPGPQCPPRPTAHPVHICSLSRGRSDFLLALLCPAFGYSSWLMAVFTNSGHRPTTKYCVWS